MKYFAEPLSTAGLDLVTEEGSGPEPDPVHAEAPVSTEGELTRLIRHWMSTSGQDEDKIRVVPDQGRPDEVSRDEGSSDKVSHDEVEVEPTLEPAVLLAPGASLPRRRTGPRLELAMRAAVLINAHATSPDAATDVMRMLAGRGTITVCRAYADWSGPGLREWATRLRHHGLQSFHHFAEDDEQAIVAMVIDAMDIAREASVDVVVLVGHLESTLPLVHRLHVQGVRVIAVGPSHTPHDVRAACDEFLDFSTLAAWQENSFGRHRA